ncbi:hypothetical protein [Sorangium sp. So ce1000]|uniref:hypothetical protein n=1 Tax=Sorangium sp. So ce1000 TaxID=3133325 RepID=UPI003F63D09C
MTRMKLVGLLMAGLALVACGDDEGSGPNGGGGTGSDLDGKQLGQLTAAESQEVCDDLAGSVEVSKEDICEVTGVFSGALGADCATAKAECINKPEEPEQLGSCDTSKFAGCTATVAETKACLIAVANAVKAITCSSSLEDVLALQQPAACAPVSEKCPELLQDEPTDGEGP